MGSRGVVSPNSGSPRQKTVSMDRPPQYTLGELVRSRIDPSVGYVVVGHVYRASVVEYLVADSAGCEEVRSDLELEAGERQRDPIAAD